MRYYGTITGLSATVPTPLPAEDEEEETAGPDWGRLILLIAVAVIGYAAIYFLTKKKGQSKKTGGGA